MDGGKRSGRVSESTVFRVRTCFSCSPPAVERKMTSTLRICPHPLLRRVRVLKGAPSASARARARCLRGVLQKLVGVILPSEEESVKAVLCFSVRHRGNRRGDVSGVTRTRGGVLRACEPSRVLASARVRACVCRSAPGGSAASSLGGVRG